MPTRCNTKPLEFEGHGRRRVVADFDGGPITSDAGALLLRRVERRLSLIDQVAACFTDHRNPDPIQHSRRTLIAQRIVAIALGYEDLNDHGQLRHDALAITTRPWPPPILYRGRQEHPQPIQILLTKAPIGLPPAFSPLSQ